MIGTEAKRRRPLVLGLRVLAVVCSLATAVAVPAAAANPEKAAIEKLPEKYRTWLQEVDVLISKEEKAAFLKITEDYQRDAFIERFWQARDPYPDTSRNELRERWDERLRDARQNFGSLTEDRSRMLLLNGTPDAIFQARCGVVAWPLQVWFYDGSERMRDRFFLFFVQRWGVGAFRLWQPSEGVASLIQFGSATMSDAAALQQLSQGCSNSEEIVGPITWALRQGPMGYSTLMARLETPPDKPHGEWVGTFQAYSTELPAGSATFEAQLDVRYPARRQSRSVMQGVVTIATDQVGRGEFGDKTTYDFVVTGEVLRGERLFESFRYKFDLDAAQVAGPSIPVVFERYLRPGGYRLVVKIEDLNGKKFWRGARELDVPVVEGPEAAGPPIDPATVKLLEEANAAIKSGENVVQIIPPRGELLTGLVRFDTFVTGETPADVVFSLNGKPILTKKAPPWSVELDMGRLPRTHRLRVTSRNARGEELASDEMPINANPNRFAVKLIEPRPGKTYSKSLRAEAEVETPEGQVPERVEFYLNEEKVATLFQPPFAQAIVLPPGQPIAYVRAVAYLLDGNSTERVVFVNAPANLEEVEVQFVELYTAVVDKATNRPAQGLEQTDFRVFEEGVEQEIRRFEKVEDLPIYAGILLDTSASMEESLDKAQAAALKFIQDTIQKKDRAMVIPFNDRPVMTVKPTNDLSALAGGLAGLKAERGTALYDSLIFALYYFNGVRGQRAILLLSDGKDESSRFTFEDTLDYSRRSGVAIYPIGLGLERGERDARRKLSRLAEDTGGQSFFIASVDELPAIYAQIQRELRSKYLLAYQSSNPEVSDKFRAVEVKVQKSGLEAKTIRGYYP
jgi:VWFA-related protein